MRTYWCSISSACQQFSKTLLPSSSPTSPGSATRMPRLPTRSCEPLPDYSPSCRVVPCTWWSGSVLNYIHTKFLIDTSTLDTVKSGFCEFGRYDEFKGPVYSIIATIKRIFCISKAILYVAMGFNICEGFIYYRTLKHISRYCMSGQFKR